jgi:peptidase M23-like protein
MNSHAAVSRLIVLASLTLSIATGARAAEPPVNPLVPVAAEIPEPPVPFRTADREFLAYEIHLVDLSSHDATLENVEVFAGEKALARYSGKELLAMIERPGADPKLADKSVLAGDTHAIVFLWVPFEGDPPHDLTHRLTFKVMTASGKIEDRVMEGLPVAVSKRRVPVLVPPLSGGPWVARGIGNDSYHRRGYLAVRGRAVVCQRFAIDWGKLDAEGHDHTGEGTRNADYAGYGEPVFAVADATVSEVLDGLEENDPPTQTPKVPMTYTNIPGNHIVLDLGDGLFALYAHLKPGSLQVKMGDRVHAGDRIAALGDSGNAVGPHLHFHISDSKEPIAGEGIPFAIESFRQIGTETPADIERGQWKPTDGTKPIVRREEFPGDGAVLVFGGAADAK